MGRNLQLTVAKSLTELQWSRSKGGADHAQNSVLTLISVYKILALHRSAQGADVLVMTLILSTKLRM